MWKISIDATGLVDGFYPPDYQGVLPEDVTLIDVEEEEKDHIYNMMPAYYDFNEQKFKQWITPEPTLTELKTSKLVSLETEYDNHVSGSFTTSQGYLMQFDTSDSLKMQGAITLMEAVGSSTGYLTQANDVTVYNIPIETMKQVLIEMLNAYAKCHARKQELRSLIDNAQSKEELAEIVISWPV